MRLSPSLSLIWGKNVSFAQFGLDRPLAWTNFLSTSESDQVGIFVDATHVTTPNNVNLSIYWAAANEAAEVTSTASANVTGLFPESIALPGAQASNTVGDTVQNLTLFPTGWVVAAGLCRTIWVATGAPYFQLAVWPDSVHSGDYCTTYIQLASLADTAGIANY